MIPVAKVKLIVWDVVSVIISVMTWGPAETNDWTQAVVGIFVVLSPTAGCKAFEVKLPSTVLLKKLVPVQALLRGIKSTAEVPLAIAVILPSVSKVILDAV